ncbi:hypothetical protein RHGRI_007375 [Rhododendron griersonianum]|uniref:Transposase MuDR plant domain-containing protein n=1 Tax=Rhododendron griersonianum TaxID=479676 RepID=A0AAV6KWS0_9ERIC|nr:hypothetical protein RHGRI_007375 [Rhododendron griersonianum]
MASRLEKLSESCEMVYVGTRVLLREVKKLRKEIKRLKEDEEAKNLQVKEDNDDNDDEDDDDDDDDEDDNEEEDDDDDDENDDNEDDEDKDEDEDEDDGDEDKGTNNMHYQQVITNGHKSPIPSPPSPLPNLSMGIMENAVVLLCKRGDVSCGVLLERTLSFQSLMTKLFAKWKDLSEGSFSLSYSFAGHPKCLLESDEDLCVLYALTLSSRTECVDVAVKDLVDTSTVSTVVDVCSKSGDVGCDQLVLLDSVGTQVDLLPSFSGTNNSKVLKSTGWCNAIVGVGQVFLDGAVGFRDALSMYSLFHGFKYVYAKNDAQTVKAVCLERHTSKECNWIVKAKLEMPSGYFIIKQFVGEHTCGDASLSYSSSRSTSSFVGRLVSEDMRSDESKRPVEVMKDMKKHYGVEITYRRAWMVVKKS